MNVHINKSFKLLFYWFLMSKVIAGDSLQRDKEKAAFCVYTDEGSSWHDNVYVLCSLSLSEWKEKDWIESKKKSFKLYFPHTKQKSWNCFFTLHEVLKIECI